MLEHPRLPSKEHFNDIANTPLWSCLMGGYAVSALAAEGHDVRYLDAVYCRLNFAATLGRIASESPDLLAVNAVYFWEQTPALFEFLALLRKEGFFGHITLFGFFPTLVYEPLLEEVEAVDSVVVGECEHTLVRLAEALNARHDPNDIAGLALRTRTGRTAYTPRPPEKAPDIFPPPFRVHGPELTAGLLGSRGCYNHCSFCPIPSFYSNGALWRSRSARNIVDEIQDLKNRGFNDFYFHDPNFVGPGSKGKQRAMGIAERLAPLDIQFGMETRPNDLTPDLLAALRAAGLTSLLMGVESAAPGMLKSLGKSLSRDSAEGAIRLCRRAGIEPEIGFLMFMPDCTPDDIRQNFVFLKQNNLLDRLDRTLNLLSHRQIVLKGTAGYAHFQRQGRLTPTGALGFEGIVSYLHPAVDRFADMIIEMCSQVLSEMAVPESPYYWGNGPCGAWEQKNAEVVAEFECLLSQLL